MAWTSTQSIHVLYAVCEDRKNNKMAANVNLVCPVCDQPTLAYDYPTMFDGTIWCHCCKTGLKQGGGHSGPTGG